MSSFAVIKKWLQPEAERRAAALYISLVEQSRNPFFYDRLGVPDTLDGRFDLILLHTGLAVLRLRRDDVPETYRLAQGIIETFLGDMDRSLREMGVGDMGVGRRVHKMADAFYGRLQVYDEALKSASDAELDAAITRNIYGTVTPGTAQVTAMRHYARALQRAYSEMDDLQFLDNRIELPNPSAIADIAC